MRNNRINLFPNKLWLLESPFKALYESVKRFVDFALFHRKQAA
jgi:hypothetical protein